MTESDEWPKTWDEITDTSESEPAFGITNQWVSLGTGARLYGGTLYVDVMFGSETDNKDQWLPFEEYVRRISETGYPDKWLELGGQTECPDCGGTGVQSPSNDMFDDTIACDRCGGCGRV